MAEERASAEGLQEWLSTWRRNVVLPLLFEITVKCYCENKSGPRQIISLAFIVKLTEISEFGVPDSACIIFVAFP